MPESSLLGTLRILIRGSRRFCRISHHGTIPPLRYTAIFGIALAAILAGCQAGGTEYLGQWKVAESGWCSCVIDITKNGDSFLVKSATGGAQCDVCRVGGIFTLTPEHNLTSSGMVISFDKEKKQIILTLGGNRMYYLSKDQGEAGSTIR
jgi:hypothetical protein